jgi:hypothetical protein
MKTTTRFILVVITIGMFIYHSMVLIPKAIENPEWTWLVKAMLVWICINLLYIAISMRIIDKSASRNKSSTLPEYKIPAPLLPPRGTKSPQIYEIQYNWHQFEFNYEAGEDYSYYRVGNAVCDGEPIVIEIKKNGESYDIYLEDGTIVKIYNPNKVIFKKKLGRSEELKEEYK